ACSLNASSNAALRADVSGGGPVPLTVGGIVQLDTCRLAPNAYPIEDDTVLIAGAVTKSLTPVALLGNNVCTRTLRAEGWCDCGANSNSAVDIDICRDSCIDNSTCSTTDQHCAEDDDCPVGETCTANTATDACLGANVLAAAASGAGECGNGPLTADFSGASGTGDCGVSLSVEFKITPGAANGADGTACTADDLVAPTAATGIPLTTGTAVGNVQDAGAASDPETGAVYSDTRSGSPISSCAGLDSSTLTGLSLVGTIPALDGTAPIGDALISLTLTCL
ncbi:MAG TPA: hypothetical protein VEB21_07805, partial [Terriglobales bacterium]|nr:hypothetical protein [Terriglobales bacterium]